MEILVPSAKERPVTVVPFEVTFTSQVVSTVSPKVLTIEALMVVVPADFGVTTAPVSDAVTVATS